MHDEVVLDSCLLISSSSSPFLSVCVFLGYVCVRACVRACVCVVKNTQMCVFLLLSLIL